jgi:hypothetical protein
LNSTPSICVYQSKQTRQYKTPFWVTGRIIQLWFAFTAKLSFALDNLITQMI